MPDRSPIRRRLAQARDLNRAAFIPFLMAGDPTMHWTPKMIRALIRGGADIVELGVPFSDPVADGKVNQRAAERALKDGTSLEKILLTVDDLRRQGSDCPVVLFTYLNPLLRMGLEKFADRAKEAGVQGVLTVDLPPEEASEYVSILKGHDIDTVFLASPTTSSQRLERVGDLSTGFVYYIARLGVTGKTTSISQTLAEDLDRTRQIVSRPIAVGFGVSSATQVKQLAPMADAVVVGSALVKFNEHLDPEAACRKIESECQSLAEATQR